MARNLSYGYSGDDVKELQELLNQNGASLDVDGKYGPATETAVKEYQKNNNLSVDGIAGVNTIGSLRATNTQTQDTASPETNTTVSTTTGTESSTVQQAQQLLNQLQINGYSSEYSKPLSQVIDSILNREPFEYDVESDPLYQNYRDLYQQRGKLAMEDTIGKAAALTGGYGNSYAQQVGQQTYQSYMDELGDVQLDLYNMAQDQYDAKTNELYNQFSLLSQLEEQDYDRWYTERALQQSGGSSSGTGSGDYVGTDDNSRYVETGDENQPYEYQPPAGYNESEAEELNDGLSWQSVEMMQISLGVTPTGVWDAATQAAAGGLGAAEARKQYLSGNLGTPVGSAALSTALSSSSPQESFETGASTSRTNSIIRQIDDSRDGSQNRSQILDMINRRMEAGTLNDNEVIYLMDYYNLWDLV